MSYPAYETFGKAIGRGYATWRVYMALQPPTLDFVRPRDVKAINLALELRMGRRHVASSLVWLLEGGYLVEHSRDKRGVRSLTLAYAVQPKQAA